MGYVSWRRWGCSLSFRFFLNFLERDLVFFGQFSWNMSVQSDEYWRLNFSMGFIFYRLSCNGIDYLVVGFTVRDSSVKSFYGWEQMETRHMVIVQQSLERCKLSLPLFDLVMNFNETWCCTRLCIFYLECAWLLSFVTIWRSLHSLGHLGN